MRLFINKFEIKKLFGTVDVEIDFNANAKIIVGENGCGKTTILSMIYYTICEKDEDFLKLIYYDFDEIIIYFQNARVSLLKKDIVSWKKEGIPMAIRRLYRFLSAEKLEELIENVKTQNNLKETEEILHRYDISLSRFTNYVTEAVKQEENQTSIEAKRRMIRKNVSAKVIYLPTYRRIEDDLDKIEIDLPTRRRLSANASMNFGMQDVENLLKETVSQIQEGYKSGFSEFFRDIILDIFENRGMKADKLYDKNGIITIIERMDRKLFDDKQKESIIEKIRQYEDGESVNQEYNYFLNKLLNVFEEPRKAESKLRAFAEKCNKYLFNKKIYLDEETLRCVPCEKNGRKRELEWQQLSSGEKQIVSVFAKLYLDKDNEYIILFDEPEISLSIEWQKTYLADIYNLEKCAFLLAVTHSPFVFDNCLDEYATSLTTCMKEV